jgi:hypothetical protein
MGNPAFSQLLSERTLRRNASSSLRYFLSGIQHAEYSSAIAGRTRVLRKTKDSLVAVGDC